MLTNVNNELTTKALNLYFELNTRPDMVMFLEQIYGSICDSLEIEPDVDLSNVYADSPNYQRTIICETVKAILSLDADNTSELNMKLQDMLAHIEQVEGRLEGIEAEDGLEENFDDEDDDDGDEDEDEDEDE